jgi:hypothetical protein
MSVSTAVETLTCYCSLGKCYEAGVGAGGVGVVDRIRWSLIFKSGNDCRAIWLEIKFLIR